MIYQKAIAQLQNACTDKGILASTIPQDNYRRIWSRDGIMAGIGGLVADDVYIIQGLKATCITLAESQLPKGTIASNVPLDKGESPSYGSIAGRVDATSWFVIGCCLYYIHSEDQSFWNKVHSAVLKASNIMDAWEFNDKHLIYTPLSGNWADEYPLHGYLLYDNLLRYWGLALYNSIEAKESISKKVILIRDAIEYNFLPTASDLKRRRYHPKLYAENQVLDYGFALAGFNPARYYPIFDACANGLAMLLGFQFQTNYIEKIATYTNQLFGEVGADVIPAFWPPIEPNDPLWKDLEENYAYAFKNHPYQFHNGGIWPIMMGWYSIGLHSVGLQDLSERLYVSYNRLAAKDNFEFSEYFDGSKLEAKGKKPLSYSATGGIFMHAARSDHFKKALGLNYI